MHGTTRFIGVRTVSESAVTTDLEYLRKEMTHFLTLKIYRSESFNSRGVNNGTIIEEVHLAESRGVHSFVMRIGYLTRSGYLPSEERIEQGRLADTGIAA